MAMKRPRFKGRFWLRDKEVVAAVRKASIEPLMKCGLLVESAAKRSMKKGGGGGATAGGANVYYNSDVGRYVKASAPGTPPHVQTGNLRSSIAVSSGNYGGRHVVAVGPTLEGWYGVVHEFGGKRHPPRPFMRPALESQRKKFPMLFKGIKLRMRKVTP
jgi:HK97 gp10 family phage protein